jgi:hypothetical protein
MIVNHLAPELSAHCTLQKTQDLNSHPSFCEFLANNLDHIWFSQHYTTCQLMSFGAKGLTHSVAHMTDIPCIVLDIFHVGVQVFVCFPGVTTHHGCIFTAR